MQSGSLLSKNRELTVESLNSKMPYTFLVIAFLICIVFTKGVETEMSRSFAFAAVVNTSRSLDSEDQVLSRHKARSAVGCAHKCLTNKQCQVIGFNAKSGDCWLLKSAGRNGLLTEPQDNIIRVLIKVEDQRNSKNSVDEFSSCKEVLDKGRSKGNGIYNINSIMTYCHMDELPNCGGGGWTLTMKINGSKNTFDYNSSYWTNRQALKTENGLGLEDKESKLPTYWSTPLTKICLGMKMITNRQTKWLKLELKQRASSLYDVITTGNPTQSYSLLGVSKWKNHFFPTKYLHSGFYIEGVSVSTNSGSKVRLGVISKVARDSHWCDSLLGFGMWYGSDGHVSCGKGGSKELSTDEPAFCYILSQ